MNNTHTIITKGFATAAGEGERIWVEYVCWNVCHPMCAIPIFTAAGRIKPS